MAELFDYTPYHHYFEKDSVESNGKKLHLDVYVHDKNAPTIIMIPGTSLYSLCYVELMYKLGEEGGFNFVGFDPRGHGRSEGTRGDYSVNEIMEDAQATIGYAIERFNEKVSLLGSSQGGIVAFYLACIEDRIQSVVCQNFADLTDSETLNLSRFPNLSRAIKPLLKNFGKVFSETQIPVDMYLHLGGIKIKNFGNAKAFIESDPLALSTVSIRALKSLCDTPMPKKISEITTPVMVFQGTDDTIFPVEYTQSIFDKLNCKKEFKVFEGLNHALVTDNVEEILPSILDWLWEIYPESKKVNN